MVVGSSSTGLLISLGHTSLPSPQAVPPHYYSTTSIHRCYTALHGEVAGS